MHLFVIHLNKKEINFYAQNGDSKSRDTQSCRLKSES